MKQLIVSADDFGLAVPVNEAVEQAHREGVLRAASLMVGGDAAKDAVERAHRMPELRVGLHLVVAEGRPVLPIERVSLLVDERGALPDDLVATGFRYFFRSAARRQLADEIRAQFEAFRATGLPLDHVNAHNHMHLHPSVLGLVLEIGGDYGMRAVRVPHEAPSSAWRTSRGRPPRERLARVAARLGLVPWIHLLRRRLRAHGIRFNDQVLGLSDTGHMDETTVLRLLESLPEGITEMYFHVATGRCPELDRTTPEYQHEEELEALVSPRVRDALAKRGVSPLAFSDLPAGSSSD